MEVFINRLLTIFVRIRTILTIKMAFWAPALEEISEVQRVYLGPKDPPLHQSTRPNKPPRACLIPIQGQLKLPRIKFWSQHIHEIQLRISYLPKQEIQVCPNRVITHLPSNALMTVVVWEGTNNTSR